MLIVSSAWRYVSPTSGQAPTGQKDYVNLKFEIPYKVIPYQATRYASTAWIRRSITSAMWLGCCCMRMGDLHANGMTSVGLCLAVTAGASRSTAADSNNNNNNHKQPILPWQLRRIEKEGEGVKDSLAL